MKKKSVLMKPSRVYWWKGFYMPVRNSWSHALELRHLTPAEKEQYIAKFGDRIILDTVFDQWMSEQLNK